MQRLNKDPNALRGTHYAGKLQTKILQYVKVIYIGQTDQD